MKSRILINPEVLSQSHIAEKLLHREGQLKELERCLKPVLHNKIPKSVFLVGPSGTGKTIVARWILESYFSDRSIYVNCGKYRSTHDVLKEILLGFGMVVHGREKTSDLIKKFEKIFKKEKVIVCLDEVDQFKESSVLWVLARNACG